MMAWVLNTNSPMFQALSSDQQEAMKHAPVPDIYNHLRPQSEASQAPSGASNPVASLMSNLGGGIVDLVKKYFPADQVQNALKIMQAESGGNPQAVGDNYPIDTGKGPETIPSYGLFQIRGLPGRPDAQTLLNPEANVAYAASLFKSQGWRPWSTARKLGLS